MNTVNNILGASNLSDKERSALDYYGSDPSVIESLLKREQFDHRVWEPTSGHRNIVNVLIAHGYDVKASDIFDYGFGDEQIDFLNYEGTTDRDLIFNPPYMLAGEFIEKALQVVQPGHKVIALLRLQFLEGQKRYAKIFKDNPPATVYVFSKRKVCSAKDDFTEPSAVAYAIFVWVKGSKADPVIKWITE